MNRVRAFLDGLYTASGVLAALALIVILSLIVLQMLARWTGEVFPGAPDYAGYAMAAASFLAFAHALQRGAHIRVSVILNAVPAPVRRVMDTLCFLIGTAVAWYFVWFAVRFTYWSWKFNDISQGQDATPLWIPQTLMTLGAFILAVAMTDCLAHLIFTGESRIRKDAPEGAAKE